MFPLPEDNPEFNGEIDPSYKKPPLPTPDFSFINCYELNLEDQTQEIEMRPLEVCLQAECGSGLRYPLDWDERGHTGWNVTIRCPNCEHVEQVFATAEEIDRFDDILTEANMLLHQKLKDTSTENMKNDCDFIIGALNSGLIQPEDF